MPMIFVSYRREDTAGHAGRLFDRLQRHFGKKKVFWDVSGSIEPGEQFDTAIERAVASCDVLLAVIGQRWLSSAGADGATRLENQDDFVRLEIAKALRRGVRVIPVLVHGAELPTANDLPEDLQDLSRHQAIELSDARWDFDVAQLIASLDRGLGGAAKRKLPWRPAALALGLAALAVAGWVAFPQMPFSEPETADIADRPEADPDSASNLPPATTQRVQVPLVTGMPLKDARVRLAEAQLKTGDLIYLTLGQNPPGTVYCQKSKEGALVRAGSAIGLCVEREKLPGIRHSGQLFLADTEVFDLDGTSGPSRGGFDIRFDASDPVAKVLQPKDGAKLSAMGRRTLDASACQAAAFSDSPVRVLVGERLCVQTNAGRYGMILIEDVGETLKIDFDVWVAGQSSEGTVRLIDGESFHFKTGDSGRLSGGDLYVGIDRNGGAQFWANNRGQRGILDLGDIGGRDAVGRSDLTALDGFHKFGVPVIPGHTYVSLARQGEEGHFIVFDVTGLDDFSVTLAYEYH